MKNLLKRAVFAAVFLAVPLLGPAALGPVVLAIDARAQDALVYVDEVRSQTITQTSEVLGRLVALRAGLVAARISGQIDSFEVEVGDRISAGDVLAQIDRAVLTAQRDLATARVAEAEARRATQAAAVELARQAWSRMNALRSSAAFNPSRLDDLAQEVNIAEAQLAQALASINSARAELQLAELNLGYAQITAPYSGIVVQRLSEVGDFVQSGEALVRLIDDESMEIEAEVPVTLIPALALGTEVSFTMNGGAPQNATVRAIIPEENPLTRTRPVRFIPQFADGERFALAESVNLFLPISRPREAVTVHKDAVIQEPRGPIAYAVVEGVAELRSLTLGQTSGNRIEVLSGLEAGDIVVVRGNETLFPGQKLTIGEPALGGEG